jgi:predicted nucleic acid-binding protein
LNVYVDTSLIVSLYLTDANSAEARRWMAMSPRCWLTPLHRAEWAHAVERQVFLGRLSSREAAQFHSQFRQDRAQGMWVETDIPDLAFEVCEQLGRAHAARLAGRTLDSLHVACALELKADQFWTFDVRQAKLARAAGLKTR